jgi:hypothetical protein
MLCNIQLQFRELLGQIFLKLLERQGIPFFVLAVVLHFFLKALVR